ncbi:MAG: proline--tRNA ligase [Candidatus Altimarinota bacterium]
MASKKNITPRSENYSDWYLDIVQVADLADYSAVRGCMIIKPYGYSIWENFQKVLDKMIKDTGHQNAYFPLFIPKSFLTKEAQHVDGFAKECAIVTHHRLKATDDGVVVDPEAKLPEELIIRPTSETIIYDTFSKWISSYRDLPLLINQWANVVRWEMRTRPFLRTTEFLWQEGHTAHATYDEAEEEAKKMLGIYQKFCTEYLATPVIPGKKSESEKFAGALHTYCIEAMMQDGKALQAGTSHNLGQNFAKAFDVKFANKEGGQEYVWQTSWGVSTRLIGQLIMTHSDDKGLVLPPNIAPIKVVIVPIWKDDAGKEKVLEFCENLKKELSEEVEGVHMDTREHLSMGERFYEWEKKGVPVRIEIGPRDLESGSAVVVRRDLSEKTIQKSAEVKKYVVDLLPTIQKALLEKAEKMLKENSFEIDDYEEFKKQLDKEIPGFIYAHWCGVDKCEEEIKAETKASTRCFPFEAKQEEGKCIKCGMKSSQRIIFAKAY